ncbi:hypothetical protein BDQ17DRAFT_1433088 [Cyathus striatus]|nr:hypothetical protein BDQ17DRAFT_1433088 [Cyathus striatus]
MVARQDKKARYNDILTRGHNPRVTNLTSVPAYTPSGTAFGVPWAQGEVDRTTPFKVVSEGEGVPVQSWPLAYWPDASLKWTAHTLAPNTGLTSTLHLSPGTPTEPSNPASVTETKSAVTIRTGSFTATVPKSGTTLLRSLSLSSQSLAQEVTLVLLLQSDPEPDFAGGQEGSAPKVKKYEGKIESVVVEQSGSVRAVIKVTGKYTGSNFPFTVRIYISAGSSTARIIHFFIYDGDQNKDFIKGLGLQFKTPFTDDLHNRHIRFLNSPPSSSSEKEKGGIWGEPGKVLSGLRRDATEAVLNTQFEGTKTPDIGTWSSTVSEGVDELAVWNDFSLTQLAHSSFTIRKRSTGGSASSWIDHAGFGERAAGVGYIGGAVGGGVVFGLRGEVFVLLLRVSSSLPSLYLALYTYSFLSLPSLHISLSPFQKANLTYTPDFWQNAPRSLDIRGAGTSSAATTLWAWSPSAPAMDMRHYDTAAHGLDLAYEDVGDPDPTPMGIGRSYEVTLMLVESTPSRDVFGKLGAVHTDPPQLVAKPEFYASHRLFGGRWNVPNTSTSGLAAIEKRKSELLDFYINTRRVWRYDVGGYAWDNGELATDLWLWTSFLRTGRSDLFKAATAMTRHLAEVDFHHTGTFAGLGSRHNVSHWGDGAKEARVAGSSLKRPFYYLTSDELIGDIMDYSLQADESLMVWDPLRKVSELPAEAPGRLRIGPDWTTLVGNWFVKWERTNDTKWRDRIKVGMNDIGGFKYGLFTGNGAAVGWDADTGHLVDEGGEGDGSYHLTMIFGGGELLMEVIELITDEPEFDAAWLDFCRLYNASNADKKAKYGKTFKSNFQQYYAKLQAYAGERLNDSSVKAAAWVIINNNAVGVWDPVQVVGGTDVLNPINEIPDLATNDVGQLSLSEYAVMAIAPELAPSSSFVGNWDGMSLTVVAEEEGEEYEKFEKVGLVVPLSSNLGSMSLALLLADKAAESVANQNTG